MFNTSSSNNSETTIFILQKGGENVNFRQQQRSLIKMYARTSLNTHAPKNILQKNFGSFQAQFQIEHRQVSSYFLHTYFLTVFANYH